MVGGLVAENAGSLDQTYATGRVTGGTGSILGGLVGSNTFSDPSGNPLFPQSATGTTGTATNSYWDTQTTGQSTSAGGTGVQTAQLVNVIPNGFADRHVDHERGQLSVPRRPAEPAAGAGRPGGQPAAASAATPHDPQFPPQQQPDHIVDNTIDRADLAADER